ncbi:MAG TPA: HAMP domain-containing protein, partial [Candidatus Sulfotelmatobacter sp.]|nr:HAMP domain-containing protein [Candidatus Sulfotelmatobacter sp.]
MSIWSKFTRKFASWGMVPRTRLAHLTLYVAGTEAVLLLLQWVLGLSGAHGAADALSGWIVFLGWVIAIFVFALALRWFRSYFLWSVRNRLIITYLFIGGVPVALLTAMALGSGYVVIGHLATFVGVSEILGQEQRLAAANAAAVEEIERHNETPEQVIAHDPAFPGRSVAVVPQSAAPKWLKSGFAGLVTERRHVYLRAAHSVSTARGPALVISSVPFDQKILARIANKLGSLSVTWVEFESDNQNGTIKLSREPARTTTARPEGISAGSVPAPLGRLDRELAFGGLIQSTDWETGDSATRLFLGGTTRFSTLYSYLAASMGIWTGMVGVFLVGATIALALVVLTALIIGISLTRRITYSVANLYKATQYVNRGDFTHRIQVRERDQLATLQLSFNSMTESLQRLIAEQKERERLQSELEIA